MDIENLQALADSRARSNCAPENRPQPLSGTLAGYGHERQAVDAALQLLKEATSSHRLHAGKASLPEPVPRTRFS